MTCTSQLVLVDGDVTSDQQAAVFAPVHNQALHGAQHVVDGAVTPALHLGHYVCVPADPPIFVRFHAGRHHIEVLYRMAI